MLRQVIFGYSATRLFLNGLKTVLRKSAQEPYSFTLDKIKKAASIIEAQHRNFIKDTASAGHLKFVSHILAAYQVLLPQFENPEVVVNLLKASAMMGYKRGLVHIPLRLLIYVCRYNPDRLRKAFSWMMRQYGATFSWSAPHQHDKTYCEFAITINRCFYFNFFNQQGVPFLTPILCQLDALWFDLIDAKKHGFIFDRSRYQTQGYGAATCIFPIIKQDNTTTSPKKPS